MKRSDKNVSSFYNGIGWESDGSTTGDARMFEDLRTCAAEYISKCRLRVLNHIPEDGDNILDMASGPIQYREYLEYSKNFKKRYCVDLSARALADAEKRIGAHGEYCHGDFLDMDFQENFFDCSISLHTIFHIDKNTQEAAVRKLLEITKPNAPVIIVYSNPDTLVHRLVSFGRRLRRMFMSGPETEAKTDIGLYYHAHPLSWWQRFKDVAEIEIEFWRSFDSSHQKKLIPNNQLGKTILSQLFKLESRFPRFFVKHFQYPMFILRKKASTESVYATSGAPIQPGK